MPHVEFLCVVGAAVWPACEIVYSGSSVMRHLLRAAARALERNHHLVLLAALALVLDDDEVVRWLRRNRPP
eukprot:scaffold10728_cov64-Phaeocystis_antarctica.AAC.4